MNNYPMGAANDPNAPYNDTDKTVERAVSVSLSFTATTTIYKDATEEEIKNEIENDVIYFIKKHLKEFKDIVIDEVEVIDD